MPIITLLEIPINQASKMIPNSTPDSKSTKNAENCAIFLKPAVHFGNFYTLDLLRGRIENFSTEAASSGIQAEAPALDGSLLEVCVAFMVKKKHRGSGM